MSSKETTDNFWTAWGNFEWQDPAPAVYRCYYLDNGDVDIYTMEEIPGNYIQVTREQYILAAKPARVVDGQLVIVKPRATVEKLMPDLSTGTMCHPQDVCVVVDQQGIYWNKQQYEIN